MQSRITFAHVCVLVIPSSPLPASVSIDLNGKKLTQNVVYDWKPAGCSSCSSFSHNPATCPSAPARPPNQQNQRALSRGRSRNRPFRRGRPANLDTSRPRVAIRTNTPTPQANALDAPPLSAPAVSGKTPILEASAEPQPTELDSSFPAQPLDAPPEKQLPAPPINDLNQLPVLPPSPSAPLETINPSTSTSTSDSFDSSNLNPSNSPLDTTNTSVVNCASPNHTHALRSLSVALKSPSKDPMDLVTQSNLDLTNAQALAQSKCKKKGKK